MKILYVYKDYFPVLGGIENHTRQLAEGMRSRGHEVSVLVTNTNRQTRREVIAGVPVFKAGRWVNLSSAPLSPRFLAQYLAGLYRQDGPDIVHLQGPYPPGELAWLLGAALPFARRPRSVLSYQSDIVRQKRLLTVYAPALRQVLRRVDLVLASSPNYIESSAFLRPVSARCRVVPLGIDPARFEKARPTSNLPGPGPWLLFTGRLRYYKGLRYLVEALPHIKAEAKLAIVGSGPMEASLREQVARLDLEKRVFWAGEVPDATLPGYYQAADLFVLPASERSEAFGLVQLEAMAAGLAVVSTDLGTGTSYVNLDKQTGLVVPPADPRSLADAINRLLTDEAGRHEMGRRGQARVQAEFNLSKMCDRVEAIYMELSSGG